MGRPRRRRDPIATAPTSATAVIGALPGGPLETPLHVMSLAEFERAVGTAEGETADTLRLFFENGGREAFVAGLDEARPERSLQALAHTKFNILVIPATARLADGEAISLAVAAALLAEDSNAFYIADPPATRSATNVARWAGSFGGGRSSAVYFPRLRVQGPSGERDVPASGAVAGLFARIDTERGVWTAPAGTRATVRGVVGPSVELDDAAVDALGQASVNAVRRLSSRGTVVWGARTRADTDTEWKYVNVRRLFIFIEESLEEGLQWVVFEPNAEPLWTQVRAAVQTFLNGLLRQGAFPAATPEEAYFVRCDRTTMTRDDIDSGRLVMQIGIAPIRPAEFVVSRIGMWTRTKDDD